MDWEVVVVGGWRRFTTEMPAVPINHSPPVIDSVNVVCERPGKLARINQVPKLSDPLGSAAARQIKGYHHNRAGRAATRRHLDAT